MASLTTVNTAPSPNRINSVENLSNNKRMEYKIYYETNDNGKKTLCGEFTFLYDNKIKNINVNKYIMDEIVNRNVLNGFTKELLLTVVFTIVRTGAQIRRNFKIWKEVKSIIIEDIK